MAAWSLVYLRLRASGFDGRIVIQRNEMDYLRPIDGAFEATCRAPSSDAWDDFVRTMERRDRGPIRLDVALTSDGEEVGRFRGSYVALRSG